MIGRRRLLGILAGAIAAPIICRPGLLMPVRPLLTRLAPRLTDLGAWQDGVALMRVNGRPGPGQYRVYADGTYEFSKVEKGAELSFSWAADGRIKTCSAWVMSRGSVCLNGDNPLPGQLSTWLPDYPGWGDSSVGPLEVRA